MDDGKNDALSKNYRRPFVPAERERRGVPASFRPNTYLGKFLNDTRKSAVYNINNNNHNNKYYITKTLLQGFVKPLYSLAVFSGKRHTSIIITGHDFPDAVELAVFLGFKNRSTTTGVFTGICRRRNSS